MHSCVTWSNIIQVFHEKVRYTHKVTWTWKKFEQTRNRFFLFSLKMWKKNNHECKHLTIWAYTNTIIFFPKFNFWRPNRKTLLADHEMGEWGGRAFYIMKFKKHHQQCEHRMHHEVNLLSFEYWNCDLYRCYTSKKVLHIWMFGLYKCYAYAAVSYSNVWKIYDHNEPGSLALLHPLIYLRKNLFIRKMIS